MAQRDPSTPAQPAQESRAPVVIVGAGPVGASLALLLARSGVRVLLIERQRDFAREFRGEVILPTGRQALEEMGLTELLMSVPQSEPDHFKFYIDRKPILEGTVNPEVIGGTPLAVSQPALLEALVAEAKKHPSFELRRGVTVREVLRESGRATGVRVRDENREERIPARLVIGTDGRSSVVRRDAGIPVHADAVPIDIVWCKFPPLPDTESEMAGRAWIRGYLGNGHLLLSYVSYDGQIQVGWIIFKGSFGALRRRGMPEWIEEMAHQVSPDLAAHFRRHRDQITHPFLLDTASDRVRTWSAPGMLLLGDAAHTMSPVGGQGINVGLRDTIVAANHLLPALRRPDDVAIENACRAIEAERVDEITKVQRLQALPPRLVFGTAWWARGIRRLLPHLVQRSFVQQNALKQLGTFFRGTTDVRLEA